MAIESISRRPTDLASPPTYRSAPHNIEAEQALLGAILVNNNSSGDFDKEHRVPLVRRLPCEEDGRDPT